MHIPNDAPPQPRLWAGKDPVAAARLAAVREALTAVASQHHIPTENLLTPDHVRRLAWRPPTPLTKEAVDTMLAELGARQWQRELTVGLLTPLLVTVASDEQDALPRQDEQDRQDEPDV